ncbi:MAG: serpin family protein [Candidatus Aenigmarchaeota archaeon]|nr:serpin family protein [Candidatus Aenigmarchaeota archaeon]
MRSKIAIIAVIAALIALFIILGPLTINTEAAYAASDEKAYSVDKNLVAANNRFAFSILKELSKEDADKNVFISPFSISTALAMTYGGSEGTTKEAMAKTLEFSGMDRKQVEQEYSTLIKSLENADYQVKLSIADSVWIRKEFEPAVKQDFITKTKESYDSEIFTRDFSNPETAGEINGWISKETNGKIDKMIDKIDSDLVMFLINAIYFKGQWAEKFDASNTKPSDFSLADGSKIKVNMMARTGKAGFYEGSNFIAARLPYGRDKIAMYIFLPDEEVSVDSFIESLDQKALDSYILGFNNVSDLVIGLPKFKIEYGVKRLNGALKALGMGIAFSDSANFSGIADANLAIDFVDHKAFVDVNEEGTEAAAATVVGTTSTTSVHIPKTFIVDRPFFFIIRDDRSGTILFMGKIVEPTRA